MQSAKETRGLDCLREIFPADALGPMSAELPKDAGCRQSGCGYFRGAAGDAFLAPAKQKPLWHAER
jgi:hypothetical protein